MRSEKSPDAGRGVTRREALELAGAAMAGVLIGGGVARASEASPARARISIRVGGRLWLDVTRRRELLALVNDYRDVVDEVALFTGATHPPLPLAVIAGRGSGPMR
jgi:hypothetical protein